MSLEVSQREHVGLIELDRPRQMNALTVDVAAGFGAAATALVKDGARALVISGRGGAFCAGADLTLVKAALAGSPERTLSPLVAALHDSIKQLRAVPVPVIAAVEGAAVGAGMGLALAADLRVAGRGARLVPGYLAIGASPDGGVSYFLTRMVGPARAMSLLVRNQQLTAAEAQSLGLVDQVVADAGAVDAAVELARSLATVPPLALIRVRELVDRATTQGLSEQLDLEQRRVTELWETHDFHEGISAFLERRSPSFRGS